VVGSEKKGHARKTWSCVYDCADRNVWSAVRSDHSNAQEARQLKLISEYLTERGYVQHNHPSSKPITEMPTGTFGLRMERWQTPSALANFGKLRQPERGGFHRQTPSANSVSLNAVVFHGLCVAKSPPDAFLSDNCAVADSRASVPPVCKAGPRFVNEVANSVSLKRWFPRLVRRQKSARRILERIIAVWRTAEQVFRRSARRGRGS